MKPEILSPAGNFEKLQAALRYGADAVYLAGQAFGMRAAADNFTHGEMIKAASLAHSLGKKVYLTVNTMPREYELPQLSAYLDSLRDTGVDALIVSDLGVMSMAHDILPHMPLHISTQASAVNSAALRVWHSLGAERVVLARELTLEEIKEIKRKIGAEIELEVFVHGSMCVSWSGRCLLSNYFTGRDGNRGMCAQPCRWEYRAVEITEVKRPDMSLPVIEDGGETFIMSSKDMCMIEHMAELCDSGAASFKIEGRMKSAYYTAVVTNAYRMALDAYFDGKPYDPAWGRELDSVSHRTYGTGYFFADSHRDPNVAEQTGYIREKAYLATVLDYDPVTGLAKLIQRNKFTLGDPAEIISPGKVGVRFASTEMYAEDMTPIESAPHAGMIYYLRTLTPVLPGDIVRSGTN